MLITVVFAVWEEKALPVYLKYNSLENTLTKHAATSVTSLYRTRVRWISLNKP